MPWEKGERQAGTYDGAADGDDAEGGQHGEALEAEGRQGVGRAQGHRAVCLRGGGQGHGMTSL